MRRIGFVIKDRNEKYTINVVVGVDEMGWAAAMTLSTFCGQQNKSQHAQSH